MRLSRVETRAAPADPGRVRLVGEIIYDDRPGRPEELWFEVDAALADSLSRSGNPFLTALLPLAATLREPIRMEAPVDPMLHRGACEIGAIWRDWYPWLGPIEIEAPAAPELPPGPETGAFFSGGVDSFYTVLRGLEETGRLRPTELVLVAGFDVRLDRDPARRRRRDRLARLAKSLGLRLVEVSTNLKETRIAAAHWNDLSHGCALAATGLVLERRYGILLVASTFDYAHLHPLGSHPLTDPLLSTAATRVLHHGAEASRGDKVEYLSRSPLAMENLHVCWRQGDDVNCGVCEKCLRTRLVLELAGASSRARLFPAGLLDLDLVARILIKRAHSYDTYYREISEWALRSGRRDIHRAIEGSHRSSRLRWRVARLAQSWRQKRLLWRAGRYLRAWTKQGRIA
ncbi:MAG TPA: hypothetical protein VH854_07785 [Thermoanaerobaculia bacterium]|jgi:hypothetical protein|nr:hypothetical protein [Thermoanaerobaculia bacterium]